jgi:translation elongation factor EF-Tu-like GTPase
MVEVSANPPLGIDRLFDVLKNSVKVPVRDSSGPFLFSVDHCFPIKGQGTVMTGTVLNGQVKVNQVLQPVTFLRVTDYRNSLSQGPKEGQIDANVSQASGSGQTSNIYSTHT